MRRLPARRALVAVALAVGSVAVTAASASAAPASAGPASTGTLPLPVGAPGTVTQVAPTLATLAASTTTTAPSAWSGSSYVSSASGSVSTGGAATPTPAATAPLTSVPAGLGPVDHRQLAAEVLAGAMAAAGALGLARRRRRQPRRTHGLIALAAATASAAVVPVLPQAPAAPVPVATVPVATVLHTAVPEAPTPVAGDPGAGVGQPIEVDVAALGVHAPVVAAPVDVTGTLQVPRTPTTVGWWSGGAVPGSATGTAVLAGHVDYGRSAGAFARLAHLVPGDVLTVTGAQGVEAFRVTSVTAYPKTALPWAALFTAGGPSRLALVTCGGAFDPDSGHYADNVVVVAVPVVAAHAG